MKIYKSAAPLTAGDEILPNTDRPVEIWIEHDGAHLGADYQMETAK